MKHNHNLIKKMLLDGHPPRVIKAAAKCSGSIVRLVAIKIGVGAFKRGWPAPKSTSDLSTKRQREIMAAFQGCGGVSLAARMLGLSKSKVSQVVNIKHQRARSVLARHVRRGLVLTPEACSACGASGRVQAHHPNYNRPLEVEWLCSKCHWSRHSGRSNPGFKIKSENPLTGPRQWGTLPLSVIKPFSQALKEWRGSRRSQRVAAKLLGTSLRSIQNWEQGQRCPRPVHLKILREKLKTPISYYVKSKPVEQAGPTERIWGDTSRVRGDGALSTDVT